MTTAVQNEFVSRETDDIHLLKKSLREIVTDTVLFCFFSNCQSCIFLNKGKSFSCLTQEAFFPLDPNFSSRAFKWCKRHKRNPATKAISVSSDIHTAQESVRPKSFRRNLKAISDMFWTSHKMGEFLSLALHIPSYTCNLYRYRYMHLDRVSKHVETHQYPTADMNIQSGLIQGRCFSISACILCFAGQWLPRAWDKDHSQPYLEKPGIKFMACCMQSRGSATQLHDKSQHVGNIGFYGCL